MKEWIIRVDGMMCSMCEAHVNDAIRRHVSVKKVASSHRKGEVRVVADAATDEEQIFASIKSVGYRVLGYEARPYKRRRLFGL